MNKELEEVGISEATSMFVGGITLAILLILAIDLGVIIGIWIK